MNLETDITTAKAELKRRKEVFPKLVAAGRIHQNTADLEIARMLHLVETLAQLRAVVQ